ncbi:hypothetical protein D3C75_514590 [compost metagenome]
MNLENEADSLRELFNGYYTPTEKEFAELWKTCTFVFDTNTLLNLFRYPKDSRDLLLNLMKRVKDRIWLPYQVAMEYHKHLIELIHNQENEYEAIHCTIEKSLKELNNKLMELRHSNIRVDKIIEMTSNIIKESKKELESQKEYQPDLAALKEELDILVGNRIGREYNQDELNKIYEDGQIRYSNKIPPGFKDISEKKTRKPSIIIWYIKMYMVI